MAEVTSKVRKQRIVKEVSGLGHNWRVVEKVLLNKVNYYLLQDCNVNEEGKVSKALNIYNIVKESLDIGEKFTGKIWDIPDIKRTLMVSVVRAKDMRRTETVQEKVPYIHRINDVGIVTDEEGRSIFGEKFEGFTLRDLVTGAKENLFYDTDLVKGISKKKSLPEKEDDK